MINQACALVPQGDRFYAFLQRTFGRLDSSPVRRLRTVCEIAAKLRQHGVPIAARCFLEVGSGHKPIVPIGLALLGAKTIYTVDLNRRLNLALTRAALDWIVGNERCVREILGDNIEENCFMARMQVIREMLLQSSIDLTKLGINYLAPADARALALADHSIDCHLSVTTFEHIPAEVIGGIMSEAGRLLKVNGVALHFIDPSDHFSHQDPKISAINFLKFSDRSWNRIAGNQFAYCNRLRASDYKRIFEASGFVIAQFELEVDAESLQLLQAGFKLAEKFVSYEVEDLATTTIRAVLRVG